MMKRNDRSSILVNVLRIAPLSCERSLRFQCEIQEERLLVSATGSSVNLLSLTIHANESASLSLPMPSLRATSQPDAALTRTASADAIARRTVSVNLALSLLHHSTTCVSSSSFTACGSRPHHPWPRTRPASRPG